MRDFSFSGPENYTGRRDKPEVRSGPVRPWGWTLRMALQHLQTLLPELPQVNAERLARYYWKEESSANAVAKIDYEIDRRTDREINRVWYGEEYCKSFDEGYINGAVKALAGVIKDYGISLNDSCLQNEADSLNLSLGELRARLDAKLKEMEHPEEK